MSIQVHFINPNTAEDTSDLVSDLLTLLAIRKLKATI